MSSSSSSSSAEDVQNAIADKFHDLPASSHSEAGEETSSTVKSRLFNRQRSLHKIFGGGTAADSVLWRNKFLSAGIMVGATVIYLILEHSGYTFLTILSNLLLVTLGVLFVWSNAAVFLNRSPPPLPNLHVSEEAANSFALALRVEINKLLAIVRDITLGKDFKMFLKVIAIFWGLSIVGGWFHFLTVIYIAVLVSHTIPVIYENYEDQIELYARKSYSQAQKQYKKVDENVLSKVWNLIPKMRKSE